MQAEEELQKATAAREVVEGEERSSGNVDGHDCVATDGESWCESLGQWHALVDCYGQLSQNSDTL